MARDWAIDYNVPYQGFPADWGRYGKGAGPVRNRQMLALDPDAVQAFHNDLVESSGTLDMCVIADKKNVPVFVHSRFAFKQGKLF